MGSGTAVAALHEWERTRLEREETYMAENRAAVSAGERDSCDMQSGGGYENVALSLMRAIARDERTTLILNVRNRGALRMLDRDAIVEVPCHVDANGPRPLAADPLPSHAAGLVCAVKAVERDVIEAAAVGSRELAVRALAMHPLVKTRWVSPGGCSTPTGRRSRSWTTCAETSWSGRCAQRARPRVAAAWCTSSATSAGMTSSRNA